MVERRCVATFLCFSQVEPASIGLDNQLSKSQRRREKKGPFYLSSEFKNQSFGSFRRFPNQNVFMHISRALSTASVLLFNEVAVVFVGGHTVIPGGNTTM